MRLTKDTLIEGQIVKKGQEVSLKESASGEIDFRNIIGEAEGKASEAIIGRYYDIDARNQGLDPDKLWGSMDDMEFTEKLIQNHFPSI